MSRLSRYSPEVRERAVRLVREHGAEHPSEWAAIESIAGKLGCTAETLRKWVRQAERDNGLRGGLTTAERQRAKALEREVRELKRINEILRKASAYFAGSSHECMHGSGQWQVRHAVIEVADVIRCCPEAIGFMNDELGFVVQAFNGTVVDGHAEVVGYIRVSQMA